MSGFYYLESKVHTASGEPLYATFIADEKVVSVSANELGERQQVRLLGFLITCSDYHRKWYLNDYPASPLTAIIPVMDPTLETSQKEIDKQDYVAILPKDNYVWNMQNTSDGYT
jgi:hypothetical protein